MKDAAEFSKGPRIRLEDRQYKRVGSHGSLVFDIVDRSTIEKFEMKNRSGEQLPIIFFDKQKSNRVIQKIAFKVLPPEQDGFRKMKVLRVFVFTHKALIKSNINFIDQVAEIVRPKAPKKILCIEPILTLEANNFRVKRNPQLKDFRANYQALTFKLTGHEKSGYKDLNYRRAKVMITYWNKENSDQSSDPTDPNSKIIDSPAVSRLMLKDRSPFNDYKTGQVDIFDSVGDIEKRSPKEGYVRFIFLGQGDGFSYMNYNHQGKQEFITPMSGDGDKYVLRHCPMNVYVFRKSGQKVGFKRSRIVNSMLKIREQGISSYVDVPVSEIYEARS